MRRILGYLTVIERLRLYGSAALLALGLCGGCIAPRGAAPDVAAGAEAVAAATVERDFSDLAPVPSERRKGVAVCSFENRTKRGSFVLMSEAPGMLKGELIRTQRFRVIAWDQVQATLIHNNLRVSDLFTESREAQEKRYSVHSALLHDYYVWGEVTRLSSSESHEETAFKARRSVTAHAEVEIFMRDATTGEILFNSRGRGRAMDSSAQTSGVGAVTEAGPELEIRALQLAINDAVYGLVKAMERAESN